jgi:hypothetical protein
LDCSQPTIVATFVFAIQCDCVDNVKGNEMLLCLKLNV